MRSWTGTGAGAESLRSGSGAINAESIAAIREPKINPLAHLDRCSSSGIHWDSFFARNIRTMAGTSSRTNQGAPAARNPPLIQASTENPVTVSANNAAKVTLRPRSAFQNQVKVKNESTLAVNTPGSLRHGQSG